jgi:hypothetical protein
MTLLICLETSSKMRRCPRVKHRPERGELSRINGFSISLQSLPHDLAPASPCLALTASMGRLASGMSPSVSEQASENRRCSAT